MKKLLLLSGLAIVLTFLSASAGIVEKIYQFEDYSIIEEGTYQIIAFDGLLVTGKTGEPALPYQDIRLMLAPGEEAVNIKFIGLDEVILPGFYTLYPQQPSRPLSIHGTGEFQKNQVIYSSDATYPNQSTGILKTAYMNGYAIAMSTFTPLIYNPATGQVSYYKTVKISITTQPSTQSEKAMQNLTSSAAITARIQDFVQNSAMMNMYSPAKKSGDDYQMLIITPVQFENEFQEIIDLYSPRGIKTQVVTKETINSIGTGQDLAEKIRNYIIQEYQDNSIEYVLLGGDVEHIPYRGFYCYVQSGSGYESDNIPADLYYSALDGTWNDDNDNNWGEIGEDDLLPEVAVGRFSFSNLDELENMIHKTTSYQDNPVLGEFNDVTLAGEWLYSNPTTYGSDYLELLIGYQNENGYETWGIPETYNFHKLYESTGSWSASDLRAEINSGRQFVHHVGHANSTYVAYMYNSDITNANFSGANGVDHNYTLFLSHGCICGAFDDSDCIMEKMASIDNFAVAVIGNSRYGWFNEGQTEGPGAHLNREMVDAMYHEKMQHLGAAFVEMKIQTAPWVTAPGQWEEGALRWNFYDINILGDPALSVWTAEPVSISTNYQSSIPIGVTSTAVNVTSGSIPMENFMCVMIKDGEIYGTGITDASGNATINFDPVFTDVGEAQLVVSGYNCMPTSYTIDIIPNDGAYIIYAAHEIDDTQGNGNGLPDFAETIELDVEMENVGSVSAENVIVTLSTSDANITITDGMENYGSISGNSSLNIENAFEFEISDNIPDQHQVVFVLEAEGDETWSSDFMVVMNAPELAIGSIAINDVDEGNGNGLLDPGETVEVLVEVMNNGHCPAENTLAALASSCSYLTILSGSSDLGSVINGSMEMAIFTVELDESAPIGSTVDLGMEVVSGGYQALQVFVLPVGLIVEDFESGDFNAYGWEFDGDADWTITNAGPYEGVYAARSGVIGDQEESVLMITMNVTTDDEISFFRKVSSEDSYDYLRFYIDNTEMDEWAGEEGWTEVSFPVSAGEHTFKWAYEKDYSVSGGSDCAWIDYITFPAATGAGNFLSIMVTANPDEICSGESSQLNALANGGSGSYTYAWEPTTGLSDPSIANPTASPDATTTYTVTVDDGDNVVSDEITLVVHDVPENPVITNEGDHLLSSAPEGNQWYDSNGAIPGATGQTYYPAVTDDYYVVVSNAFGCESDPSNLIYFVVTGIQKNNAESFSIFPNPFTSQFTLEYLLPESSPVNITLVNKLGQVVDVLKSDKTEQAGFYSLVYKNRDLRPGIYFLSIQAGKLSVSKKLILTK
jgi:hypothetical protein